MTTTAITYEPGTLYQVEPGALLLERNIRDSKPTPEMVESIAKLGVLEPITAVLTDDGRLLVRFGHRRVLAAIEGNVATVPVYVTGSDDAGATAEVDRIIRQRDENTYRNGLTAAEETGVVEQLVAFGLSAAEISKQARVHKDSVSQALAVADSKLARKAAAKYSDLTLDQAAAIADFDDDPKTAQALIVCALEDPNRFTHTLQRARDDRQRAQAKAEAIAKLEAGGVKVVDAPGWDSKTKATRLDSLVDGSGKNITTAAHKKCPGHVAWITTWGDTVYGCTNPTKNSHRDRYGSTRPTAAEMTDKEREKAKTERKLVIENNKAWASAETVRREWLATFAKTKTPPKGTAAFIADALSVDRHILTHESHTDRVKLYADWGLSTVKVGYNDRVTVPATATEGRALVIALLQVLAAHESSLDKLDWRRNGETERHGRYLRFLASCGYPLSDVEQYAISSKTIR